MDQQYTVEALKSAGIFAEVGPAEISQMFFDMMEEAESRYGPGDTSWLFGGINYTSATAGPAVRTPRHERKIAVLCLTEDTFGNYELRRWQLSHEIVHLLSPTQRELATVLEEGLASYEQFRTNIRGFNGENLFSMAYQQAFDLVRPLVERHPAGIRELRAEFLRLSPLQPAWVMKHFPSATEEAATRLCEPFYPPQAMAT